MTSAAKLILIGQRISSASFERLDETEGPTYVIFHRSVIIFDKYFFTVS